jgi:hypothetical protein
MVDGNVSNLPAGSRFAAQKTIFDDESRADTGTNREKSQRVGALPGTEAMFCECGCICIVFEANGDAIKGIAQRRGKWIALAPAWQCGGGPGFTAARIRGATDADTDTDWTGIGALDDFFSERDEESSEVISAGVRGCVLGGAVDDFAAAGDQGCGRFCASKVDAKYRFHP